jgi:hypothetical protein
VSPRPRQPAEHRHGTKHEGGRRGPGTLSGEDPESECQLWRDTAKRCRCSDHRPSRLLEIGTQGVQSHASSSSVGSTEQLHRPQAGAPRIERTATFRFEIFRNEAQTRGDVPCGMVSERRRFLAPSLNRSRLLPTRRQPFGNHRHQPPERQTRGSADRRHRRYAQAERGTSRAEIEPWSFQPSWSIHDAGRRTINGS